jgi:hypothetical protein
MIVSDNPDIYVPGYFGNDSHLPPDGLRRHPLHEVGGEQAVVAVLDAVKPPLETKFKCTLLDVTFRLARQGNFMRTQCETEFCKGDPFCISGLCYLDVYINIYYLNIFFINSYLKL